MLIFHVAIIQQLKKKRRSLIYSWTQLYSLVCIRIVVISTLLHQKVTYETSPYLTYQSQSFEDFLLGTLKFPRSPLFPLIYSQSVPVFRAACKSLDLLTRGPQRIVLGNIISFPSFFSALVSPQLSLFSVPSIPWSLAHFWNLVGISPL